MMRFILKQIEIESSSSHFDDKLENAPPTLKDGIRRKLTWVLMMTIVQSISSLRPRQERRILQAD